MREIKFRAWDGCEFIYLEYQKDVIYNCGSFKDLQQFIGIKDKNGKEIYEKDIISFSEHYSNDYLIPSGLGIVKWELETCMFVLDTNIDLYPNWGDDCNFEIIGNIYENKDLVE